MDDGKGSREDNGKGRRKARSKMGDENKIISGHNEIVLDRRSDLNGVAEQLDGFFDYPLVVINNEILDRLDKLELNRSNIKLVKKVEGKSQWVYTDTVTPKTDKYEVCSCDDCLTKYVVFSLEACDFMSNPSLEECIPQEVSTDSDSSSSDSSSSSDTDTSSTENKDGNTGSTQSSQSRSSESSNVSDILTDGWSNTRSSDSIAGSLSRKSMKTRVPSMLDTAKRQEGPDTTYVPQID